MRLKRETNYYSYLFSYVINNKPYTFSFRDIFEPKVTNQSKINN